MGRKTDPKIIDFVRKARKKFSLQRAIFFGSRARGDYFKHSDYDIILVSSKFIRKHQNEIKELDLIPAIVEEYPSYDMFEIELDFL